jgi:hypothetical protein
MTLRSQIIADVSTVFLQTDEFAESCKRYIGGDPGNIQLITGIPGDDRAATEDMVGRGYTHVRTFDFAEASVLEEKDSVVVSELRYEVVHITDPDLGMRTAILGRYQPEVKGGKYIRKGTF